MLTVNYTNPDDAIVSKKYKTSDVQNFLLNEISQQIKEEASTTSPTETDCKIYLRKKNKWNVQSAVLLQFQNHFSIDCVLTHTATESYLTFPKTTLLELKAELKRLSENVSTILPKGNAEVPVTCEASKLDIVASVTVAPPVVTAPPKPLDTSATGYSYS